MDEKEIFKICQSVDSAIAEELAEAIMYKVSFETLEAHHGILPISRRSFYRRKGTASCSAVLCGNFHESDGGRGHKSIHNPE